MQKDKSNFFYKNELLVIDKFGRVYTVLNNEVDLNHWEVFQRLEEERILDILEGYEKAMDASTGLDLSSFIAAKGYTVFWPFDIGNPSIMIITTPRIPTNDQAKEIKKYMNFLVSDKINFETAEYESSSLISCINIFDSVNLRTAIEEANDYLDIASRLNEYSNTFYVDTKGPLVKK